MKHLFRAVLILLVSAGMASAASFADIDQSQTQFDGGISGAITGAAGFIGGAGAAGEQQGLALSDTFGDTATGTSMQQQVQMDQSAFDNGDGNFAGTHGLPSRARKISSVPVAGLHLPPRSRLW